MSIIKAIFVGDEPTGRTRTPFRHAKCAQRLQEWIDYLVEEGDYVIVNQSDYTPFELCQLIRTYKVPVIALGRKASQALNVASHEHFMLPHPSGLNRQINNKAKLTIALMQCKDYLGT